jgi:ubiquinone/menaquinone biosynthesis C-methylase UbiE
MDFKPELASALALKYGLLESQTAHRLRILSHFNIPHASRVLEIGCGQGDFTAVIAHHVSLSGEDTYKSHVDAVDPAPLDYGAPETLGHAQDRLKSSDIGRFVEFHRAEPIDFLLSGHGIAVEKPEGSAYKENHVFDVAILCHSLWYFKSSSKILETFSAVGKRCKRLCVVEWSLSTSTSTSASNQSENEYDSGEAYPHILAALTRATCEAHIPNSKENIRTPISPAGIKELAREAGWTLESERLVTPSAGLDDARWEIYMLLHEDEDGGSAFIKRAREHIEEGSVIMLLESMLESVKSAVTAAGGKEKVRCMDVWVGTFAHEF